MSWKIFYMKWVKKLSRKCLNVWFIGESGRDTGGLTREMFTLYSRQLKSLCDGQEHMKIPRHDATILQVWLACNMSEIMACFVGRKSLNK